jgi:hypothetical protein
MVFVEVADDVDGADILGPRNSGDESKRMKAAALLVLHLSRGECKSSELKVLAEAEGISERWLQIVKDELGVEHESRGFPRETYWRLPQSRTPSPADECATVGSAWLSHSEATESPVAQSRNGERPPAAGRWWSPRIFWASSR